MAARPPRVQGPAPRRASRPEPLGPHHDLTVFGNGKHPSLDEWLRERARASEGLSARTYVACDNEAPMRVVGYYAIATAVEQRSALPSAKLRRGMPDRIPLLLIARLAVDKGFQGSGLGSSLLVDAHRRCHAASEIAGARGVVAHAIDDAAVQFYEKHGFVRSPLGERVMLIAIETISAIFEDGSDA